MAVDSWHEELTNIFMMILPWKKYLASIVYTQIFQSCKGQDNQDQNWW